MRCPNPHCSNDRTRILDTKRAPSVVVRHHYCDDCGLTFETEARIAVVHVPSARGPRRSMPIADYQQYANQV